MLTKMLSRDQAAKQNFQWYKYKSPVKPRNSEQQKGWLGGCKDRWEKESPLIRVWRLRVTLHTLGIASHSSQHPDEGIAVCRKPLAWDTTRENFSLWEPQGACPDLPITSSIKGDGAGQALFYNSIIRLTGSRPPPPPPSLCCPVLGKRNRNKPSSEEVYFWLVFLGTRCWGWGIGAEDLSLLRKL